MSHCATAPLRHYAKILGASLAQWNLLREKLLCTVVATLHGFAESVPVLCLLYPLHEGIAVLVAGGLATGGSVTEKAVPPLST